MNKPSHEIEKETEHTEVCQQAANNSYHILSSVLQNLDAAVWVTDRTSNELLYANHQAELLFRGQDFAKGGPLERFFKGPASKTDLAGKPSPKEEKESPAVYDVEFQAAGASFAFVANEMDVDWLDGRKARLTIARDVTGFNRLQEALRESEARLSAALDSAAHAIVLTDVNGRFTRVNSAWEQMFGYNSEEALRLTHLDVTQSDFVDISREKVKAVVCGEIDCFRIEKKYIRKDGSVFWGDLSFTPIRGLKGDVGAAVGIISDVSERKRAEEELKKAHDELEIRVAERTKELAAANRELRMEVGERARAQEALQRSGESFRAIIETANDCVFIKDKDLRYTLVNPAMENLLDISASEIMKLQDRDLFGPEAGDHLRELDLRVLAGEIIEAEHTRPVKNIPMTFLETRVPMHDTNGEVVGICGISRNITERVRPGHASDVIVREDLSPIMRSLLAEARSAAKTDTNILITGESGAGKDHLARIIHENSPRASGPFYTINCAAIPPELAESELFGHEPGAFTGANRRKKGLLELAEGGTLLMNEIGELTPNLQAKLLTFLDSRSFTRVGGEKPVKVSARLIAATNRNLQKEVDDNRFRRDLFYRINVLSLRVPSLSERISELPGLARQIISELEQELQLPYRPIVSPEEMAKLCAYRWPGNIRELRNVLERSLIVSPTPGLKFDFLHSDAEVPSDKHWIVQFPPQPSYVDAIAEMKRNLIMEALASAGGSKEGASRLLGISRHLLRRQLETLKLK